MPKWPQFLLFLLLNYYLPVQIHLPLFCFETLGLPGSLQSTFPLPSSSLFLPVKGARGRLESSKGKKSHFLVLTGSPCTAPASILHFFPYTPIKSLIAPLSKWKKSISCLVPLQDVVPASGSLSRFFLQVIILARHLSQNSESQLYLGPNLSSQGTCISQQM